MTLHLVSGRAVRNTATSGVLLAMLLAARVVSAQLPGTRVLGGCDVPATQRSSDVGCYLTATAVLEKLPAGEVFWHIYAYPTRAAAEAARQQSAGTIVESLGKVWLFAIDNVQWRPSAGDRVAVIGPLPTIAAKQYTARFMEAVFPPERSLQTAVHRHSGPEAWFVLTGAQCLRTPESTTVMRAGQGGFVPAGPPMVLTSVGTETRRALVLVLHDTSQPWMTIAADWTPAGKCPN